MKIIAHIQSSFPEKFGIPRQSGLVESLKADIVFEPEFRNPAAFQGLEGYSHIWILWQFSEAVRDTWSPTVHPPRLGGNKRMGVFATRSPFRPNPIGLSCVRLDAIERHPKLGPVLHVSGADLMDQTPIYDIKPYLPFTDSHPEASGGFADEHREYGLSVNFPEDLLRQIRPESREAAVGILSQDPRPSYQNDPDRVYGVAFAGKNIRFRVRDGVLTVCAVEEWQGKPATGADTGK
jgi:tRNA-Thr(GGU) m(6)t(6)A37 methyltransferase TsaA